MRFERETEYDEFKTSLRELNEGIQSMAAIMNKGGSGTIWFGIRSDSTAVGMDVTEKTLRDVSQAIRNQIRPRRSPLTRNPLIASKPYRSKDIENYGSAIPRIKELCDGAEIRVEYRRTLDGTLLVFHRRDAFADVRTQLSHVRKELA